MGKIRDFFKKIGALKGIFHVKMSTVKDRTGGHNRSRRNKEEVARKHRELYKKGLKDPDNRNYRVTHLEPDIQ